MSHARTLSLLLLLICLATLLAGCGGGGGGGCTANCGMAEPPIVAPVGSVTGKIVDLSGTAVPSAALFLDGTQEATLSSSGGSGVVSGGSFGQGGYRLEGVSAGFHIIQAQAANGSVGSTQVFIYGNGYVASNANIAVSPTAQQAIVKGQVNGSNGGLGGAEVFLRFPVAVSQNNPTGYASVVGYTTASGTFEIDNVPTLNADGTPRTYTAAAAYQVPSPITTDPVYDNAVQSNLTFAAGATVTLNTFTVPVHSGGYATLTPTLNLVQALTQPDIPADVNAHAVPATASAGVPAAIYDGIRRHLSPAYAKLQAGSHAAAQVRSLKAQPHATSNSYVVEADLFFSLPGDMPTATPPVADPNRSQIYGFEIFNDVSSSTPGTLTPYEFLLDPLANFYDDPNLGANQAPYVVDQSYSFYVESEAASNINSNGFLSLGDSSTVAVSPLSFVNLAQPYDPNDNNNVAQRLANPPTFQWNTINPATNASDARVGAYTVFLYSAFPGVNTTGTAASLAGVNPNFIASYPVTPSQTSPQTFTLPSGAVTSGQEYWVVVAATASDNTAQHEAISVSQITPFFVQ